MVMLAGTAVAVETGAGEPCTQATAAHRVGPPAKGTPVRRIGTACERAEADAPETGRGAKAQSGIEAERAVNVGKPLHDRRPRP
jgi:hypothetical protein